jgi:hypothetical protein
MTNADCAANNSVSEAALAETGASGRALQLCRRLDWRFLLPDPQLRNVCYSGEPSELLSALQMYSESLTVFSAERAGPVYPAFDTVVLRYPSLEMVEAAGRMTKPEGNVYIELLGGLERIGSRAITSQGFAGLMKYARALWNLKFDDIQAYWHRPGFESCQEIVPLFDRVSTSFVLSRGSPANLVREAKLIASRCLMKTGILPHIVPCYSMIAQKRKP